MLVEHIRGPTTIDKTPFGRVKGFHGHNSAFGCEHSPTCCSMGIDSLRQASGDAVLLANYLLALLRYDLTLSFSGRRIHAVLFDDHFLKSIGIPTLDFVKALIDEGFHPMTTYFPLIVHGALLMEPTKTESRETLDQFVKTVKALATRPRSSEA